MARRNIKNLRRNTAREIDRPAVKRVRLGAIVKVIVKDISSKHSLRLIYL